MTCMDVNERLGDSHFRLSELLGLSVVSQVESEMGVDGWETLP